MIALIASTLEDEQATALSVGCNDLIGKPSFPQEDIFEATNNYIEVLYVYDEPASEPKSIQTEMFTLNPEDLAVLATD